MISIFPLPHFKRWLWLACAVGCLSASAYAQETNAYRGIIVRSVPIEGRVLLPAENERDTEKPAPECVVKLMDEEETEVLRQEVTDKNGGYNLPVLLPADYRLHIGSLKLNLRVKEPEPDDSGDPRALVVIVPKTMAYPDNEKNKKPDS